MTERRKTRAGETLAALFAVLNASHFNGRLHGYRVVRSKTNRRRLITRHGVSGVQGGYCKPVRRLIAVWEGLGGTLARRALLHEMCHAVAAEEIFDGFDHGPRWRSEMLRLADAHGERWAAMEAGVYAAEADSTSEAAYLDSQRRNEEQLRAWAQQMRGRLRTVPLATARSVACGHDHGRRTEFGVKLTLAEAIRDLTTLHDAKSERFGLITGLLHTCMHRELEHRVDAAAQRRGRFTLVKGAVAARGEEA